MFLAAFKSMIYEIYNLELYTFNRLKTSLIAVKKATLFASVFITVDLDKV